MDSLMEEIPDEMIQPRGPFSIAVMSLVLPVFGEQKSVNGNAIS